MKDSSQFGWHSKILEKNDEYNIRLDYFYIHMGNGNISKTAHFKRITLSTNSVSFSQCFSNLLSNIGRSIRKNICLVSTTFLKHPAYFKTILECGLNSPQWVQIEITSKNIIGQKYSSSASPEKHPVWELTK